VSTVVVYSSSDSVRDRIRLALGRTPDPEVGRLDFLEVSEGKAFVAALDAGGVDLCIMDGEAWPTGGMGLIRQLNDEHADPPATVLIVARRDDAWLATWSRASAVISHPIDPFELTEVVVRLLKERTVTPVPAVAHHGFGVRRH